MAQPPNLSREETYLQTALNRGRDFHQKVEIGGKYYFIIALEGGDVARMRQHDGQKLQRLANEFFNAHDAHSGNQIEHDQIRHIDSEGIHFTDDFVQANTDARLPEDQADSYLAKFTRERPGILNDYAQAGSDLGMIDSDDVDRKYLPFMEQDIDGQYTGRMLQMGIESYAFNKLEAIKDRVVDTNPQSQLLLNNEFYRSKNLPGRLPHTHAPLDERLTQARNELKQHMTAQMTWKAMMTVLFPREVFLLPDPEHEEEEHYFDADSFFGTPSSSGSSSPRSIPRTSGSPSTSNASSMESFGSFSSDSSNLWTTGSTTQDDSSSSQVSQSGSESSNPLFGSFGSFSSTGSPLNLLPTPPSTPLNNSSSSRVSQSYSQSSSSSEDGSSTDDKKKLESLMGKKNQGSSRLNNSQNRFKDSDKDEYSSSSSSTDSANEDKEPMFYLELDEEKDRLFQPPEKSSKPHMKESGSSFQESSPSSIQSLPLTPSQSKIVPLTGHEPTDYNPEATYDQLVAATNGSYTMPEGEEKKQAAKRVLGRINWDKNLDARKKPTNYSIDLGPNEKAVIRKALSEQEKSDLIKTQHKKHSRLMDLTEKLERIAMFA